MPNQFEGIAVLGTRERELRLNFGEPRIGEFHYYKVDWPSDSPLLVATLDTFDSGNHVVVRDLISAFVKANTPPNDYVHFAIASERKRNHDEMNAILRSNGDSSEIVKPTTISKSPLSMMLPSYRRQTNTRVLVASTRTSSVVDKLFETYFQEWYMESIVPFIVSSEDRFSWVSQLVNLTGPRRQALLSRDTIERNHCTMTTKWDHGMVIVSDKITRQELEETVRRISDKNSLKLFTRNHEA